MLDDSFHLYFHEDDLVSNDPVDLLNYSNEFKRFSMQSEHILTQTVRFAKALEESTSVIARTLWVGLDYPEVKDCLSPQLITLLQSNPDVALSCFGLALYKLLHTRAPDLWIENRPIMPRLYGFEPITPLRNVKSNLLGQFIMVKGTVIRVGNIRPLCCQMDFECIKCHGSSRIHMTQGKFKQPKKCSTGGCRSKTFLPIRKSAVNVDWQRIRVQELMNQKDPGRMPRSIDVDLTDELVDICAPGDVIAVCGVVRNTVSDDHFHSKKIDQGMYVIYIDANTVDNHKQMTSDNDLRLPMKDLQVIKAICEEPNCFNIVVNSISPKIFGHELVKAGLAMALFGGCEKFVSQKSKVSIRGNPHVLIVGDPGLGKSQMLVALNQIAPRGVYVCGSYSSTSGLTVTLSKEAGSGDYALEAGALVLGDQGICAIDEFDKMGADHQSLMEAMEQQSISIAKAGIVCSLPARTSVIAAANPTGGHYNRAKTVNENLKMGAALLSRFDLIFILLDKPDEQKDQLLSAHVLALHSNEGKDSKKKASQRMNSTPSQRMQQQEDLPLGEKLKPASDFEEIHPILLKKYVLYARKHVHPKLTPEACQLIQNFYLSLRQRHKSSESTPITTRQLESMIRLSEARARMVLSPIITKEHAQDVIELMKESLYERFEDQYGQLDFRRAGGSSSKSKDVSRFVTALQRVKSQRGTDIFTTQELSEVAQAIKIQVASFDDFLETLNLQQFLLKKGNRTYKLAV